MKRKSLLPLLAALALGLCAYRLAAGAEAVPSFLPLLYRAPNTATPTVTSTPPPTATVTPTATATPTMPVVFPTSEPTQPSGAAPCNCTGPDLDCRDFGTHARAQACFDYCYPRYGDIFRLDSDGDGIACEALP